MTETLLALVPTYGIWLVMLSVTLSCFALPLPSSILVMAGGGFAAAEDLDYWQLVLAAYCPADRQFDRNRCRRIDSRGTRRVAGTQLAIVTYRRPA